MNNNELTKYLTQVEVAGRFRVTQSTVKNWRTRGLLRYFQAPGSRRVLYPVDAIEEFEQKSLHIKKEVMTPREIQRKSLRTSTRPAKEWRI